MAQLYLDVHVCVCVGMCVDHSVLVYGSALFGCSCLCVCVGMCVDHSVFVYGTALFGCSCLCVWGYVCGS